MTFKQKDTGKEDAYRCLSMAVIEQALQDIFNPKARQHEHESKMALYFLKSAGAEIYYDAIGIDRQVFIEKLNKKIQSEGVSLGA